MNRILMLSALLVLAAGCLHAREVDQKENAKEDGPGKQPDPKDAPKVAKKAGPAQPKPEPKRSDFEEGHPRLSPSPTGIMTDDGVLRIQQALVKRGYLGNTNQNGILDDATSAAIRKFQGDQEMAKTGAPDRETVRRLGLSIDDVFRTARSEAR